jgi:hypothetical protein
MDLTAPIPGTGTSASASELRLEVVNSLTELSTYAEDWDCMAFHAHQKVLPLSHAWVTPYLEHLVPEDAAWECLFVRHGDRLLGVLPLMHVDDRLLGFRQTHLSTPGNLHTSSLDLICVPGYEADVIETIVAGLDRLHPMWRDLTCLRLYESSPLLNHLDSIPSPPRWLARDNAYQGYIDTTDTFEDYLRSLSPRFQRNLRRISRKLESLGSVRYRFLAGSDALPFTLSRFVELEASGWKGTVGTAIECDKRLIAFYTALVERLFARGWLEWHLLEVDEQIIAAHMAVRVKDTLYLCKIAFDERYSSYGPGNMLMLKTAQRAFELREITELNCITYAPWNDNWNMQRRSYFDLDIWRRHPQSYWLGYFPAMVPTLLRKIPGLRSCARCLRSAVRTLRGRKPTHRARL